MIVVFPLQMVCNGVHWKPKSKRKSNLDEIFHFYRKNRHLENFVYRYLSHYFCKIYCERGFH